jgi:RHS repeat-associated protein
MKTATDFNGNTTIYKYDVENRLIEQRFPNDPTVQMTYTIDSQVATVTDGRGVTSFSYDAQNRLRSRVDVDGSQISYTYDLAGNRISVTTKVLNGTGNTTDYSFDERNRLDKVIQGSTILADYDYDGVGNLVQTTLANGVIENRQYDQLNHLRRLQSSKGNSTLTNFMYSLDKMGNRQQVVETLNGISRTVQYTYDDLYRLTKENVIDVLNGNRATEFIYDKVGNRQQQTLTANATVQTTTYQYDANDRLLKEQVNGTDKVIYTYDSNGNTLTKTEDVKTTESLWNDRNRLVGSQVRDANGVISQQVNYEYDASGIRVSQSTGGEVMKYLIDANLPYSQVLVEYRPSGLVLVSYVHGNDLIEQVRDGVSSFYHVDALGSTRLLSDAAGGAISTYNYQAFGDLLNSTGSSSNNYLFAGEQLDPILGNYYNRARYYDPQSGRFTKSDDFEGYRTQPISLHKYLYANSSPSVFVDPTGFVSMSEQSAAMEIQSSLFKMFNYSQNFLGKIDRINSVVNLITSIKDIFDVATSIFSSLSMATPSNKMPLNNFTKFSIVGFAENASIAFAEAIPRISRTVIGKKVPAELAQISSFLSDKESRYAFYLPSIISLSGTFDTKAVINGKNVTLLGNSKPTRLFGFGMVRSKKSKTGDSDIHPLQFFRMDYLQPHATGPDNKNYDVWDDATQQFQFHVPHN